ncbi:MAG TPA: triose-phosphate isomerase [Candidatus Krumholzibacteria bacterium]|nr:triose-phosphate isomerase [Candidatus Krumholzibacteria bacterium]HRX49949.1 triose-phosphate isomerase [Candidatus Krumholzibacteria bacterium]
MRRILVAGNWKLNNGPAEAKELAAAVAAGVNALRPGCEVLVCPPFVSIDAAAAAAAGSALLVGAQNCAAHDSGAHTGEVSAPMLREVGCSHVIVAHSERRTDQRETDDEFTAKVDRVHAAGLTAIFCYGEQLSERKAGRAADVVRAQLQGVLPRLAAPAAENLVLAYEPVWAIGTGETATPEQAQEIHALSRSIVAEILGADLADRVRILYGGSVKASNAADLFRRPDIDGGLVGGASLQAEDFLGIVRGAMEVA